MVKEFGQRIIHLREGKLHEDRTTGLVGNLSDRLDTIRLERERERLKRLDRELQRYR
jgi:hypothetical protein